MLHTVISCRPRVPRPRGTRAAAAASTHATWNESSIVTAGRTIAIVLNVESTCPAGSAHSHTPCSPLHIQREAVAEAEHAQVQSLVHFLVELRVVAPSPRRRRAVAAPSSRRSSASRPARLRQITREGWASPSPYRTACTRPPHLAAHDGRRRGHHRHHCRVALQVVRDRVHQPNEGSTFDGRPVPDLPAGREGQRSFNSITKSHGTMTHHSERALKHLAQQS